MDNNLNNQNSPVETVEIPAGQEEIPVPEAENTEPQEKIANYKSAGRKKFLITLLSALLLMAAAVSVFAVVFVSKTTEPLIVEIGETPEPEKIHENPILSALYTVEPYTVDTSMPGEYPVNLRFFGFFSHELIVQVRDTSPPVLTLTDVHTIAGTELTCEDFVVSCEDDTGAEYSFKEALPATDEAGEFEIKIVASDISGNQTVQSAKLTVWDASHILSSELNTSEIESIMKEKHPDIISMDLADIKTGIIGEYSLHAASETARYIWKVHVADTTPPEAESSDRCIRLGETLQAEDFITEINDYSACTVSFVSEPDFSRLGLQGVMMTVSDTFGNSVNIPARLFIADIPTEIHLEYGAAADDMKNTLFANVQNFARRYQPAEEPLLDVGMHEVLYDSIYGSYSVQVTVADTIPPELILRDVTVYKGDTVTIDDIVVGCDDISGAAYAFDSQPYTESEGVQNISVTAEDVHGNKTTLTAAITVLTDTAPPVIYGVKDQTITVGDSVSFRKGVYAEDNRDGTLDVAVNSSSANTGAAGTYPIYYSCTDSSGNTAEQTAWLTVNALTIDTVNAMADQILWQITSSAMSQREKAWAIYEWCTSNLRYSTRTSYLMGQYVNGAYSGFTSRSGNCYIYYAVAAVMLTRAGIENIEIQRDDPANPHYWNLVKIGESWYHFDTCPHFAGHELQCFLLTDAEVQAYSENEVADYYSFDSSLYPATP